jgi:hypothetical protein
MGKDLFGGVLFNKPTRPKATHRPARRPRSRDKCNAPHVPKPRQSRRQREVSPADRVAEFLEAADKEAKIFLGIDPGFEGGLGLLCGEVTTALDMPIEKYEKSGKTKKGNKRVGKRYDDLFIAELFEKQLAPVKHRLIIGLERLHAREQNGGIAGFALGGGYRMWPLFLLSHGYHVVETLPLVWKRYQDLLKKPKSASIKLAQKRWPKAPVTLKKHEGRAEALLIADYTRHWIGKPDKGRKRGSGAA